MDHSQNATTLDLHGRRMEEAVSEVTLFLERIRRAATAHSQGQRRMGEGTGVGTKEGAWTVGGEAAAAWVIGG